jgi:hypothetical protein
MSRCRVTVLTVQNHSRVILSSSQLARGTLNSDLARGGATCSGSVGREQQDYFERLSRLLLAVCCLQRTSFV